MDQFNFKSFLKDNNITSKSLVEKTGYNKNTFTKWSTLETDAKLPQDFILSISKEFPEVNLVKYFPTHAKIMRQYNKT